MSVRRINEPLPARVDPGEDGRPGRVRWHQRGRSRSGERNDRVECIIDAWYVDDAWWTSEPLRRMYYECQLEHGARIIILFDLVRRTWHVQR